MEEEAPLAAEIEPKPSSPVPEAPPPDLYFPRPDFTAVPACDSPISEPPETPEVLSAFEKNEVNVLQKPTFKSALQAKKRLQAFSSKPLSPKTKKFPITEEKTEKPEVEPPAPKRGPRRSRFTDHCYHDEKAKAVIEEIEEMKRAENARESAKFDMFKNFAAPMGAPTEMRSRSPDKEKFRRVEKKSRNYRHRSPTPEMPREMSKKCLDSRGPRKSRKYPKNWREFVEFHTDFDLNRDAEHLNGESDPLKQMLFESPSLPIVQLKMKTVAGKEEKVPFEYVRHTHSKPIVSYNVNFRNIRPGILTKKVLFESLPKENAANIEKLYANSPNFQDLKNKSTRGWFSQGWYDNARECQLLDNSVGLSFLQTYTEDDVCSPEKPEINEENETLNKVDESTIIEKPTKKKRIKEKTKKSKHHRREVDGKDTEKTAEEKSLKKEKKREKKLLKKMKKKEEKKLKKLKDGKKISRSHKKPENADTEELPIIGKVESKSTNFDLISADKLTKEQVIEELRKIEEKIAKKREEVKDERKCNEEKFAARKRKISEHVEDNKRARHDKFKEIVKNPEPNKKNKSKPKHKRDDNNSISYALQVKQHQHQQDETPQPPHRKSLRDIVDDSQKVIEEIEMKLVGSMGEESNKMVQQKENSGNVQDRRTPDTDEYHSHWESDDEVSSAQQQRRQTNNKQNRSWESDEELFERSMMMRNKTETQNYANLEIPLNIKTFSRRYCSFDAEEEMRLLDRERRALSEERKKLEIEKQRILKLQEEHSRMSLPELEKKKDDDGNAENRENANNNTDVDENQPSVMTVLPQDNKDDTVGCGENDLPGSQSSFPITALENEYEEFIKAVGSESVISAPSNVVEEVAAAAKSSGRASPSSSSDSENERKKKRKRNKAKKKKKRRKLDGLLPENAVIKEKDRCSSRDIRAPCKDRRRSRSRSRDRRSPPRRRYLSPRRRLSPGRRRGLSPRRRSPSPRRRSPPPRRRQRSPYSMSPPRRRKRSLSPRIRRNSPLNSPLDGFKKSVADSTISDDMLPQPTPDDYSQSPRDFDRRLLGKRSLSPASPRRIPLDERINQVLGLDSREKEEKAPHSHHVYHDGYGYDDMYGYPYGQYGSQYTQPGVVFNQPPPSRVLKSNTTSSSKVVQVGNILQVVPHDEVMPIVQPKKVSEVTQKIVQVGNMLQIVPGIMPPATPESHTPISEPVKVPVAIAAAAVPPAAAVDIVSAETAMKQKNAERRAEREQRRLEREMRRKEKEIKRKEKDKRKQLKMKLKADSMIKRALQLETEALAGVADEENEKDDEEEEEEEEDEDETKWCPPLLPVALSNSPSKSILSTPGSNKKRKSVQFADGIRPGEGTSPSGGEELSSPPPQPQPTKMPKEKRLKKVKIPKKSKKRKIKVKVVKKSSLELDSDDDDNLPPPSPPPGSPPPHVFPSRVKTHTMNNIHPYSVPQFAYRAPMSMVMNRAGHQAGFMPPPQYHAATPGRNTSVVTAPPGMIPGMNHPQAPMNSLSRSTSYQGVPSIH